MNQLVTRITSEFLNIIWRTRSSWYLNATTSIPGTKNGEICQTPGDVSMLFRWGFNLLSLRFLRSAPRVWMMLRKGNMERTGYSPYATWPKGLWVFESKRAPSNAHWLGNMVSLFFFVEYCLVWGYSKQYYLIIYIYIILYYTIFHRLGFIIVHIGGFGPPILCFHKRHWVENSMSKIPWKNRWKIWFGPPKPGGCQINRQNAQWANRIFVYFFNIT
jgi:hypothetical protein